MSLLNLVQGKSQRKRSEETELLIEKMQSSWLRNSRQKWAYRLIFVLIVGLINASKTEITMRNRPNQGIVSSAKNVLIVTGAALLIAFLAQGFLSQLVGQVLNKNETARVLGSCLACLIWFSFQEGGGQAYIQHFSLRLVLFLNRAIPWNYARFLNYATERSLLQRIGGRYRFIHKLLQDHFAKMGE